MPFPLRNGLHIVQRTCVHTADYGSVQCNRVLKGGGIMSGGYGGGGGFALIVVLFILLVIIGASWL